MIKKKKRGGGGERREKKRVLFWLSFLSLSHLSSSFRLSFFRLFFFLFSFHCPLSSYSQPLCLSDLIQPLMFSLIQWWTSSHSVFWGLFHSRWSSGEQIIRQCPQMMLLGLKTDTVSEPSGILLLPNGMSCYSSFPVCSQVFAHFSLYNFSFSLVFMT